jgi:zinc/manganese transport system substrate-binding protein
MKLMTVIAAVAFAAVAAVPVRAGLKVVSTAPEYADLGRRVGGERGTVDSVMRGPENVHNVVAKPTEMLKLNQADLFVHGGLDAEPWRDNLLKGARNPRVAPGTAGNVDMSTGIELKDVPTGRVGRDQGDVHAFGNPHYQLDPKSAQRMAVTLAKAMIAVDPGNADLYRGNAKRVVSELVDLERELKEKLRPYAGLKVVTFHPAWRYFADAFGLTVAGTIEPKPAITPTPAQVRELIQRMQREGVRVVVCETYSDDKLAQFVAEQAGAKLVVLPDHVLGVPEADSYVKLFRYDVEKLIEAARAAGVEPTNP